MRIPEVTLWRAVISKAALDASSNIMKNECKDAEWHYKWSKTAYCKLICDWANLDYDMIADGFFQIYQRSLRGENQSKRYLLIAKEMK